MPKIVYFWWTIGFVLLAAETLIPGAALLWFGIAALALGAVLIAVPTMGAVLQVMLFGIFSVVTVGIYWKFFRKGEPKSDLPLLNRRGEQLIGRVFVVEEAIVRGQGKVKVGDTLWLVQGEDCAPGAQVRVIDIMDSVLRVEPV